MLLPQEERIDLRASKFLLEETTIIMRNASSSQLKGVSTIGWPFDTGGYGGKVGFGKDVSVGGVVYISSVLISRQAPREFVLNILLHILSLDSVRNSLSPKLTHWTNTEKESKYNQK